MNVGKSKVMVRSNGGKMIGNSVNGPVISVGKECRKTLDTVCKKRIHRQCRGLRVEEYA